MYAPRLYETEVGRETVQEFLGYNHNLRIGNGEFYDMKNLTSRYYPVLSPRDRRGIVRTVDNCNGLLAKDELCVIEGNTLRYGSFSMQLAPSVSGERQLVSMGAYILVFPDMMYVNTSDTSDLGNISAGKSVYSAVELSVCNAVGEDIGAMYITKNGRCIGVGANAREKYLDELYIADEEREFYYFGFIGNGVSGTQITLPFGGFMENTRVADYVIGDESIVALVPDTADWSGKPFQCLAPGKTTVTATFEDDGSSQVYTIVVLSIDTPRGGDYWLRCADDYETEAYVYSGEKGEWEQVTTYVKLSVSGIGGLFSEVDSCRFCITSSHSACKSLMKLYKEYTYISPIKYDTDWVVIPGSLFMCDRASITGTMTLDFSLPLMDMVFESGNRLWGCRYGKNIDGKFVNEIYASELGNFRSFYSFRGISTDSYAVSLGSDGAFTGAVSFQGKPMFFKNNCCHTIYGAYPSSYQLVNNGDVGVAAGSGKSLCVIGGVLYYHGRDGVYRYSGAGSEMISGALGKGNFKNAVGGSCDRKYYLSMDDANNEAVLFVFDTVNGIWHKEEAAHIEHFAAFNGDLYFIGNDQLCTIGGSAGEPEKDIEWFAETGRIGFIYPDSQYVGKIQLRMTLPVGSSVNLYIEYDSDGYWEALGSMEGRNSVSFSIPVMPSRCDHFRIKLSGIGECKIYSITKTLEVGGEL
ncbi:MAG: hypothetical protein IJ002_03160 [Clostridia bacterium]|nr:hypothetical protein [Clostridia bacterium]MBQ8836491.1 hypothetical protein [Clostridia bacterium]